MSMSLKCVTCGKDFVHDDEDLAMYASMDVPPPDECPRCRLRHLFAFWNFGAFRKTTSALSGKGLITVLPEKIRYPVYSREEWVSDSWDPLVYGRDYDPSRPFFEQFRDLRDAVPHPHQSGINNTSCEWCDDVWNCKACYLSRSMVDCEDCSYLYRVVKSKDSIDLIYCFEMERSYDCVYCWRGYELRSAFDCRDCIKSAFLYDCRNCQDCFMCWNLRNKQYCILNEQYSKEEYEAKMKEYDLRSHSAVEKMKKDFAELLAKEAVHRQNFNTQTADSSGNFLTECRNCEDCMFMEKSENCRHSWRGINNKDCINQTGDFDSEHSTMTSMSWKMYGMVCASYSANCRHSAYLDMCEDCQNCFGCVGLRKKEYCVFNKQYSKEEYEELTRRIKADMRESGEWGRFFPMDMLDAGYNLTNANFLFPETKEGAAAIGAGWHDFADEAVEGIDPGTLPDRVDDAPDDVVKQGLICPATGRRYNIAPHELAFYRQYGIPLPRRHFDHRISESFRKMAAAVAPQEGKCVYCGNGIIHFFSPDFGYKKIACVECYQREIA